MIGLCVCEIIAMYLLKSTKNLFNKKKIIKFIKWQSSLIGKMLVFKIIVKGSSPFFAVYGIW